MTGLLKAIIEVMTVRAMMMMVRLMDISCGDMVRF